MSWAEFWSAIAATVAAVIGVVAWLCRSAGEDFERAMRDE